jgi:hypothetical protein
MTRTLKFVSLAAVLCVSSIGLVAAGKPPDLGRTKFKDIAKYLDLTTEQQDKIRRDVERIQEIVKQADKQGGSPGYGGGGRTPVGGGRWGAGAGAGTSGRVEVGDVQERLARRQEWQKEIVNRADEIRTFLTPPQVEKFKTITIPNILSSPSGGGGH